MTVGLAVLGILAAVLLAELFLASRKARRRLAARLDEIEHRYAEAMCIHRASAARRQARGRMLRRLVHKQTGERFPGNATWAGRVSPQDLTDRERIEILQGVLGYCEGHGVLYRKAALGSCMVPLVFDHGLGTDCKEWAAHE